MKNIIDYVSSEKQSFTNREFSSVDSLVLSQMAYLRFDDFVPDSPDIASAVPLQKIAAMENVNLLFQNIRESKLNRQLFLAFVNSPRFCKTKFAFYLNQLDNKTEKQFSAITVLLDDNSAYIAFRGTDSTLIGWKEDFNMAFVSPIPSQKEGTDYLNIIASNVLGKLRTGGHSKGGNVAVYAATHCDPSVQNRIKQIYNHDGPGFKNEILQSHSYSIIKDRINKTLPQSSIIGMLLHHQEQYSIVKSNRFWFMQHDPFSWVIDGSDFQYLPSISKSATYMNSTINQWMNMFDDQERELFVNTLFQILQATEANTFYDLTEDWHIRAIAALSAVRGIDEKTRLCLIQTIWSLFVLSIKNMHEISLGK